MELLAPKNDDATAKLNAIYSRVKLQHWKSTKRICNKSESELGRKPKLTERTG